MAEDTALPPAEVAPVDEARGALRDLVNQERERHPLVVGFVAPLGTPLDEIETGFRDSFQRFGYEVVPVRLSALLEECEFQPWGDLPGRGEPNYYTARMDAGDQLRTGVGTGAALAALAVGAISNHRDGSKPAASYLLRSLKHPDEARLLRQIYGDSFSLVAVASTLEERRDNLARDLSYFDDPAVTAQALIDRDEADDSKREFGQRVRDIYEMADVFLSTGHGVDPVPDVDRFTDSLFGAPFVTPRMEEEGMRLAHDAGLRSSAIGRQVGAALVPKIGTPVVVGTNDVSKPGGGQYWTGDHPDFRDFQSGTDPNPLYTNRLVQELLERLAKHGWFVEEYSELPSQELLNRAAKPDNNGDSVLKGARASALIEFTRCMHAEQAAIVNSARSGVSTNGSVLFSTTFPCHECAKLIVGAGIVEVQYIEPYPKSLVSRLYKDVIDTAPPLPTPEGGLVGGKVPFRPFVGIAPRRYEQAFLAGERGNGAELADFDRSVACPRTGGWTSGIDEREAVAIKAVSDVVHALANDSDAGGGTGNLGADTVHPAVPPASTTVSSDGDETRVDQRDQAAGL